MKKIYFGSILNLSPRHAEYLEQIQQKAWELSLQKCTSDQGVPVIKPYTVAKKCEVELSSQKCFPLSTFALSSRSIQLNHGATSIGDGAFVY